MRTRQGACGVHACGGACVREAADLHGWQGGGIAILDAAEALTIAA